MTDDHAAHAIGCYGSQINADITNYEIVCWDSRSIEDRKN